MAIVSRDLKGKKGNSRLLFLLSGLFLGLEAKAASLAETNDSFQTEATIQITKSSPSVIGQFLPQTGEDRVWFGLLLGLVICLVVVSWLRLRKKLNK